MADDRFISVEEFDHMTPDERAEAVESGIIRSWDELDPALRMRIEAWGIEATRRRRQMHG